MARATKSLHVRPHSTGVAEGVLSSSRFLSPRVSDPGCVRSASQSLTLTPLSLHPASSWMFRSLLPAFTRSPRPEPKLTVLLSQPRTSGCRVLLGFFCLQSCPLPVAQRVLPHSCGLQVPPLQFCQALLQGESPGLPVSFS